MTGQPTQSHRSDDVLLILSNEDEEALAASRVLDKLGAATVICPDVGALRRRLDSLSAGIIVSRRALDHAVLDQLISVLADLPQWSELPIVILTDGGDDPSAMGRIVDALEAYAPLSVLERPFSDTALRAAATTALRVRRRQYQTRRQLADIAEQRLALTRCRERFRLTVEHFPGMFVLYDAERRYQYLNSRVCSLVGLSPAAIVGQRDEDILPEEITKQYLPSLCATYERRESQDCQFAIGDHHAPLVFSVTFVPLLNDVGEIREVLSVAHDVTQWLRSEQQQARLAAVVEESNDAIIGLDLDGTITHWNAGAERMYGYAAEDAVGESISLIVPDDRTRESKYVFAQAVRGKQLRQFETIRKTRSGQKVEVSLTVSPIRAPSGTITGVWTVDHEITVRKHALRQLRELNENLELRINERTAELLDRSERQRTLALELTQAEQRERERLAKLLHDHVQQLLVAAKMKLGRVGQRAKAQEAEELAREVSGLLDQAIDASRSLSVELRPRVLQEGGLVEALHWLAGHAQEQYELHVDVETDDAAEPQSHHLRTLVFHAVRELLLNIVKHAGVEHARVRLTRHGDGHLLLEVGDDGAGFVPDVTQPIAPSSGLFSIKRRLTALGGTLSIASVPGKGATITLIAPLHESTHAHGAQTRGDERPGGAEIQSR